MTAHASYTTNMNLFPSDPHERKKYPIYSTVLSYFPSAIAAVSRHCVSGNVQHNMGDEYIWGRSKSTDHLDCMIRHAMEGDLPAMAWRALAALQEDLEKSGKPIAPAARNYHLTAEQLAINDGHSATGVPVENYLLGDEL